MTPRPQVEAAPSSHAKVSCRLFHPICIHVVTNGIGAFFQIIYMTQQQQSNDLILIVKSHENINVLEDTDCIVMQCHV